MILKEYNEQSFKRTFIKTLGRKMSPKPPTPTKEDLPLDLTTNQRNSPESMNDDDSYFKVPDSPYTRAVATSDAHLSTSTSSTRSFVALSTHDTRSKSCSSRVAKNSSINLFSPSRPTASTDVTLRSRPSRLFKCTQINNINNNCSTMRAPISNIVKPGRINTRSSAINSFSKATTSRPITWRKMQRVPNAANRKVKWVPAIKWSANSEEKCNYNQWIPVRKFSTEKPPPIFHSVELTPSRNKSPEESPSLKFPWINPLNRIFLQETTTDAGEVDSNSVTGSSNSNDDAGEAGNFCDGNNKFSPKNSCSAPSPFATKNPLSFSSSVAEDTTNNPFKMTPQSTWAAQTQDGGASESGAKSILAPSKLTPGISSQNKPVGVFGCSIPPPAASSAGSILKPSALGASRLGGITAPTTPPTGASKRFCLPTVTVSSSPSDSRPAFKLKPSVLRGSASSTSSPTSSPTSSAKNPFTTVTCNTSPKRSSDESEPESKKRCTRDNNSIGNNENDVDNDNCRSLDTSESAAVESREDSDENALIADSVTCETNGPEVNGSSGQTVDGGEGTEDSASGISAPSFVPLNVDVSSKDESGSKVNGVSSGSFSPNLGGGFIFGQNLQNRVTGISNLTQPPTNGEMLCSEGNLFAEAATSLTPVANSAEGGKSLSESSRELSEKEQSLKRKYEEVEVVTGEENEKNVIQMNCKLYGWVNGSWQERGRGILRLNDREVRDELHSRVVIRTQGTLTVMLNAKIFAEMSIEKSNDKSVRFTATGTDGQPKIYLVMGSPKDITLLHNSLEYRVAAARSQSIDEKERAKIDSST